MDLPALRAVTAPVPLRKQVVESLRDAIVSGQFKPGQRLHERELCEMLGVSRTSLREGLVELESEGLIENLPNRGPVIPALTVQLAEEVYQIRAVLEALAAKLFARQASKEQFVKLEQAMSELELTYRSFSPVPFLKAKGRFYDVLLEGAGNRIAGQMLRGLQARISQLRVTSLSDPARHEVSLREIQRIVAALRTRDEDAAWQASMEHVTNAAQAALQVLRREDDPTPQARRSAAMTLSD